MISDEPGSMLNKALRIGDLMKDGSKFEINTNFNVDDEINLFDEDVSDVNETVDEDQLSTQETSEIWEKKFVDLKINMTKLPDHAIYKRVVKQGQQKEFTSTHRRVTIHYNGYLEGESAAFDSTYMQGRPKIFVYGNREVLRGIELAVMSMQPGEESQFIISYELLFGEMGVPPRIKPKADMLFIIRLINVTEVGDETAIEHISEEEKMTFAKVLPSAQDVYIKGKDCWKRHDYRNACRLFHKTVENIEFCATSNEAEKKEQSDFLAKLYTNLAVCYNSMNKPETTCLICDDLAALPEITTDYKVKGLFQHGRALIKMGEFKKAQVKLAEAQRLRPMNEAINKELRLLSEKYQKFVNSEKEIWTKAFGNIEPLKKIVVPAKEDSAFLAGIQECLNIFMENAGQKEMQLPIAMSSYELQCIKTLIKDMPIKLDETHYGNTEKKYILRKIPLRQLAKQD